MSGSVPVESGDGGDCLSDGSAAGDSFAGGGALRVGVGWICWCIEAVNAFWVWCVELTLGRESGGYHGKLL